MRLLLERLGEHAVVEVGARRVAGLVAREEPDRRLQVLVVQQREERDAHRGIGDLDARDGRTRRRVAGILDVPDDHARGHILGGGAVDDHLRPAVVDVVVRGHHRHARPFEPHLEVAARGRRDRADAVDHLARGRDDDGRVARLQLGHRLLADLAADQQLVRPVLLDRGALLIGEREQRELLPVLLEDDVQGFEPGAGRLHGDLERRRDSDDLCPACRSESAGRPSVPRRRRRRRPRATGSAPARAENASPDDTRRGAKRERAFG